MKLCKHWEDGKLWARIELDDGSVYDESITGWSMHISLIDGSTMWKHLDGREAIDWV